MKEAVAIVDRSFFCLIYHRVMVWQGEEYVCLDFEMIRNVVKDVK